MVQSQNFDVIAAHAVDGNVVLVQNQLTGARHPARSAHARMHLQFEYRFL